MGWLFEPKDTANNSRLQLVIDKIEFDDPPRSSKVVYASQRGRVVYCAVHAVNSETGMDIIYGLVALTSVNNRDYCNFGIKFMDESMGPNYYDAPAKLIGMLSHTDSEFALAWRKSCLANAEKLKSRNSSGKLLRSLPEGVIIKINDGRGTMATVWNIHGKRVYKLLHQWKRLTVKYILNHGFTIIEME